MVYFERVLNYGCAFYRVHVFLHVCGLLLWWWHLLLHSLNILCATITRAHISSKVVSIHTNTPKKCHFCFEKDDLS